MRVLLDTNVLLDSLLQRAPWNLESDEILRRAQPGVLDFAVTALTLANHILSAIQARQGRQIQCRCA